jgi:antitoxin MazE
MKIRVVRRGNALAFPIPKSVARRVGLTEGARVDVSVDAGQIVIAPCRPHYVLKDLLVGMTPEAMREAFDWGGDIGRETPSER